MILTFACTSELATNADERQAVTTTHTVEADMGHACIAARHHHEVIHGTPVGATAAFMVRAPSMPGAATVYRVCDAELAQTDIENQHRVFVQPLLD
jgi:hypothetical protein